MIITTGEAERYFLLNFLVYEATVESMTEGKWTNVQCLTKGKLKKWTGNYLISD